MFSYYGSKSKIVDLYPCPKHAKIIEPFAGSARYSLKYFEHDVLLVDKYQVIVDVWHYLQQASEKDILGLPEPKYKESILDFNLSREEILLMGFMVAQGVASTQYIVQQFSDIPHEKRRIAGDLSKIRHWKIKLGDYRDAQNETATWFIDPPYKVGGHKYRESRVDYFNLGNWCKSRLGHIIVCENTKASWLPFVPIGNLRGAYTNTTEAMWCNDFEQLALL